MALFIQSVGCLLARRTVFRIASWVTYPYINLTACDGTVTVTNDITLRYMQFLP